MTQADIDEVRLRVTLNWVRGLMIMGEALPVVGPRHLWFPKDDTAIYELREGNAPPNSARPTHLKFRDLWVEPNVSEAVRQYVRPGGGLDVYIEEKANFIKEAGRPQISPDEQAAIRARCIAEFCKKATHPRRLIEA